MNIERFPDRKDKARRTIYVEGLPSDEFIVLRGRNYDVIDLMDLPRDTPADHQQFLFALMQGMTDGTIEYSKQRLDAAELELKARHMLHKDAVMLASTVVPDDIKDLWKNWGASRHTIQGNTTMVDPARIDELGGKKNELKRGPKT